MNFLNFSFLDNSDSTHITLFDLTYESIPSSELPKISNYQQLLNNYEEELKYIWTEQKNKKDEPPFENTHFIQETIKVKKEISIMQDTRIQCTDDIDTIENDIKKFNDVKKQYEDFFENFTPIVQKEGITFHSQLQREDITKYLNEITALKKDKLASKKHDLVNIERKIEIMKEVIKPPDNSDKNITCAKCCDKSVEFIINPCGHVFCENCGNDIEEHCSICNGDCAGKINIFY